MERPELHVWQMCNAMRVYRGRSKRDARSGRAACERTPSRAFNEFNKRRKRVATVAREVERDFKRGSQVVPLPFAKPMSHLLIVMVI